MHTSLKNKITLVTGVSSGIGREIAQLLAERGARVFGTVRNVRIVNISSVLGFLHAPYMGIYAASKHAVEGYTETLDHEIRRFGVRALLVEPAYTRTKLTGNTKSAKIALDVYADERKRLTDAAQQNIEHGDDPRMVAEAVWNALTAKSPRLRYPVGKGVALSRMRRFVPAGMFDKSFRKQFQLDRRPLMAIGLLAGWLTVALMAGGCSKQAVKDPRLQSPRVEVFKAKAAGSNGRTFTGIVEARVQSDLGFRVAGKIMERSDVVIVRTLSEPGQVVAAGQTVIQLAHDGPREALINLPEGVRPDLGAIASSRLYGQDQMYQARLRQLSDAADPASRTFEARYVLEGEAASAPLGSTVTITLLTKQTSGNQSVLVPVGAVYDRGSGPGVWIVDDKSEVKFRLVQIDSIGREEVVVSHGVQVREKVVALGAHLLHEGQVVNSAKDESYAKF